MYLLHQTSVALTNETQVAMYQFKCCKTKILVLIIVDQCEWLCRAYPVYTVGGESGTMYTPASGQYYTPSNSTPVTYTQVNQGGQNQLLGNTTYLIQQSVDSEHGLIAASRTSPPTVAAVSHTR